MKTILSIILAQIISAFLAGYALAENIDPHENGNQFAYAENVGWLNFQPAYGNGVHVSSTNLTGMVWAENIGWINLSPTAYGGVTNDGSGNLAGYAWGENIGWISFSCENTGSCETVDYRVTIDQQGNFAGWAWAENIGWINFSLNDHYVTACKVTLEDLANFAEYWLDTGSSPANLNLIDNVNFQDYSSFASYWQNFCPDNWQLKTLIEN